MWTGAGVRTALRLVLASCAAWGSGHVAWAQSEGTPKVFVQEGAVNLGTIREGTTATVNFVIENRGTADLVIEDVKTTCGCTTVHLGETERVIAPDVKRDITVKFDSTGRAGDQRNSVTLSLNDPEQRTVNLIFRVNVQTLFTVLPRAVLNLRSARRGMELPALDLLPAEAGESLEILGTELSHEVLEWVTEPLERPDGTKGFRLRPRVSDAAALGRINAVLKIRGRVGTEEAALSIRISGEIVGELVAVPAMLQATSPTTRGWQFAPVTITATGPTPFKVLSATAGPYIRVQAQAEPDKPEVVVTAQLDESAPDGPLATTLLIRTDSLEQPVISIPIFVDVQPRVIVEPTEVVLRLGDAPAPRRVRLERADGAAWTALTASCSAKWLQVTVEPAAERTPAVRFLIVQLAGKIPAVVTGDKVTVLEAAGELLLATDVPGAETLRIPVRLLGS